MPSPTDWKLPWAGGCRCDQLRFQISAPPLLSAACHCTGCQRMTASAFSLSIAVPATGFTVTAGTPVIGGLHGPSQHFMCPHCMSWVFTRPEGLADLVNVRATMLDEHHWYAPFVELWTDEKLSWAITGAPHSYPKMPSADEFPHLISGFAERGARP